MGRRSGASYAPAYIYSRELTTPAVNTAGFSVTSNSLTDVTSLSVSVTVGALPVYPWISGHVALGKGTASTGDRAIMSIALLEDGSEVDRLVVTAPVPATASTIIPIYYMFEQCTPSAGEHTYKIQAALGATGSYTGTLLGAIGGAGGNSPLRLGVREAAF